MLTGGRSTPRRPLRIGLMNRVVGRRTARRRRRLAAAITANSPFGVWMTKQVLERNVDAPGLEAAIELENRTQALATRTEDMREALAAFREKRPGPFTGR